MFDCMYSCVMSLGSEIADDEPDAQVVYYFDRVQSRHEPAELRVFTVTGKSRHLTDAELHKVFEDDYMAGLEARCLEHFNREECCA